MKTMKKFGALLLALVLCMSLCVPAFAASSSDEGVQFGITIENSTKDMTYTAYKIFDVTYDGDNYSYTVSSDSPWYTLFTDDENAVLGGYGMPFVFTATTGAADDDIIIYNVTVGTHTLLDENGEVVVGDDGEPEMVSYTDEEIIGYLNVAIATIASYDEDTNTWTVDEEYMAAGSATGNGGTITISLTDPGYYFVTSEVGAIVSVTTTDPNPTITDKNPTIDIVKKIVHDDESGQHDETAEADGMGEDVSFDVTASVPIIEGENYVVDYTITDSMTNGLLIELTDDQFEYDSTTGKYYLTNDMINEWITLYSGSGNVLNDFTDYVYNYSFELVGYDTYTDETTGETVHTFSGFVLTYYTYDVDQYKEDLEVALVEAGYDLSTVWPDGQEWPDADQISEDFDFPSEAYFTESKYPTNASIEIQYSAHVSSLEGYENTNTIYLDHDVTPFKHPTPWNPTPGPQKFARDYVFSWELQILKIDGEEETPLSGATFTLASDNMKSVKIGHSYLYVPISLFDENGVYTDDEGNTYNFVDFESTHYIKSDDSYVVGEGTSDNDTYVRILTSDASVEDAENYSVTGTTDENGMLYFEGLGTGVYTLTEIVAPDGYNLLDEPIIFEIGFYETGSDEEGYVGHFTVTYGTIDENGNFVPDSSDEDNGSLNDNYILVKEIENNSGTRLPGTGGMGTTIFYIIGAILVCGAAVVLITRRRMSSEA